MKRTTRRLLSLLMAVVLCLGLTPVTAWAANFPTKFYASVNYDYSSYSKSVIFGTVTQSSSDDLSYEGFGEKTDRVVYGMEYAGGAFYTVEGTKLNKNIDDGFRELRMYNSDLTSYRTIGTVNQENGGYWIIDTAMDLSGTEPALYGTYNSVYPDYNIATSIICTINLETAKPGNYLQVTGLPDMHIIYAIAFDKDGTMYAIGADSGDDGGPATLYTIDLGGSSATATKVGDIQESGRTVSTNWIQDLAFDHASGTLYWIENNSQILYTLDTNTAGATSVGNLPALQSFCIPYDAAFAENQHMVSVICEGAGTVTGGDENKTFYMVENGGSITLTLTPDAGSGLRYVKVDGRNMSTAGLVENGYTFNNVTKNHVIEVGFKLAIPATQHDITWFHYQGEPASFYTQHHVYTFYELPNRIDPSLDDVPREGYVQTLYKNGKPIDNDEIILPGNYDVRVTHLGNDKYAALDVMYKDALQLAKCDGTPGRPVVYGKVGCTQGDLATTSALQDHYGANGTLIDSAHDEIPVTLVWQNPEIIYNEVGNFYASATIYAADELEQRLKDCYNLDDGTPLKEGCQISPRATQVVVLPADEASLVKLQTSDASGGTVSGKGVYKNGDKVTVTAAVNTNDGYEFKGWQDEDGQTASTEETYTFEADGDRTLTAVFEVDEDYRVTLKTDPQDGGTVTGGGSYEDKTDHKATVEATANTGYYFIGWYEGETLKNDQAEYTFGVAEQGITLTAKFGIDYLARAELAKDNLASSLGTSVFEWSTLTEAVGAYEAAKTFVQNPPSGVKDAESRFNALTSYYSGIQALDLSNQGINSDDLAKLYLFTGVTDLNLSGNKGITSLTNLPNQTGLKDLNLSNTGIMDLTSLSTPAALETLNLSSTGITDLSCLSGLTTLETLNLSNNKGITDLSALKDLSTLETLDISGTGVTTLESLIKEGESRFPGYQNLTAHNLTLTSLSALAGTAKAEGFPVEAITEWDFDNSTLPDTEDSKTDVEAIQNKLGDKFIPPTFKTNPTPGGGGGGATSYGVTVADCEHGKISAEPAKAAKGDTVTVTVTPDEGFEVRAVNVTDAGGKAVEVSRNADGTFSFVMPAGNVTVSAVLGCDGGTLCPSAGLTDVDQSQWYHDAVDWAVSTGVMTGFGNGLFGPDVDLTRAQMAQILWNVEGRPAVDYPIAFGDVSGEDWFHGAVAWAASEGIFEGYGAGSGLFGPEDALTREQAAAVLMRWAAFRGEDTSARADLSAYPDAGDVSEWAVECVSWAVAQGVIAGVGLPDGTLELDPLGTTSRAQTATLMMRLVG